MKFLMYIALLAILLATGIDCDAGPVLKKIQRENGGSSNVVELLLSPIDFFANGSLPPEVTVNIIGTDKKILLCQEPDVCGRDKRKPAKNEDGNEIGR